MSAESVLQAWLSGREPGRDEPTCDSAAIVDAAHAHGVGAVLWETLRDGSGAARAVAEALAPAARAAAVKELFVQRELARVLGAIDAAGCRALVIKGTALAYTIYRQPWHRPRTDTDLLVGEHEMAVVSAVLESCGYARADAVSTGRLVSHQIAYDHRDDAGLRYVIDLHWKLVNPQVLADALPFELLWRDKQSIPALGSGAWAPSAAAATVLACVHRLAHHQGRDRLIWLYDLHLLTGAFGPAEWDAVRGLALDRRVAGVCLDGLRRAGQCFDGLLPPELTSALAEAAVAEPSRQYLDGPVRRRDVLVSDLRLLPSWRARARLLREHAFPPGNFIRQSYGVTSRLWLPLLYAHRLATGARKWLRPQPRGERVL